MRTVEGGPNEAWRLVLLITLAVTSGACGGDVVNQQGTAPGPPSEAISKQQPCQGYGTSAPYSRVPLLDSSENTDLCSNPELCDDFNSFEDVEKRALQSFSSWGGKRVPTFQAWGGKRIPTSSPFQAWGGKRVPFQSWGGKRVAQPFQSWGGKRASNTFAAWGGKRSDEDDKRGTFNSWGGKRGPGQSQFSAWGGKRSPSDTVFSNWGGKRDDEELRDKRAAIGSGKRGQTRAKLNRLLAGETMAIRRGTVDFFPWGGKRAI